MKRWLRGAAALCAIAAAGCGGGGLRLLPRATEPPPSFAIPFGGPGQVVTLWSWGSLRAGAGDGALVVTREGKSQRLSVRGGIDPADLNRVRWRSPRELLVEQYLRPRERSRGRGSRG